MKLLWQQLIAIVLLIGAALALSAFLLSRYMTTQIYDQRQKVLVQYGLNIVENHFTRSDLERMSQLLKDEEIVIQVYLEDGTVIYPSYDQRNSLQLSQEQLSRITAGETIGIQRSTRYDSTGKPTNMATVYVSNEGGYREFPQGFISIGAPLSDLDAQVQAIRDNIFLAFVLAGSMGIFFAILYAFYQTRRIKRLQMASRQIASGHYEMTLPAKGKDELSDLARDFQVMADALQESEAEIQRQETLRRQMMMDAAHEMRTPLTTMNGVLEGLYYDMIPENQKNRSLELVMKETQRLTRLVNENLDYEKIRSGQIVLKRQWVQPLTVFAQIQAQLEDKAKAKGDWIEYHADPHLQVWADEDRLVQVVMNITNNAIQFTDQGAIRLSASALDQGVEIKIEDQGIGIEADKVKNIWERFYKADISRKNNEFGESGIGLAVVKSLVEAHHGHVSVASKLGEGTSFTLFFPNPQP
ncbi:TPA: ATP-binding protein [Streptococcus suis]